jgi:hypothetical protein
VICSRTLAVNAPSPAAARAVIAATVPGDGPALASALDQPVLPHPHPDSGQVEHLPALHADLGRPVQTPRTRPAFHRLMPLELIRLGDLAQRCSPMPGLPTRPTPAPGPQRPGPRLGRTIRRRRLGRVGGVLPKPSFKLSDPGVRLIQPSRQLHHQRSKLLIRRLAIGGHPTMINTHTIKIKPDRSPEADQSPVKK